MENIDFLLNTFYWIPLFFFSLGVLIFSTYYAYELRQINTASLNLFEKLIFLDLNDLKAAFNF